jgi:hypothetical protein
VGSMCIMLMCMYINSLSRVYIFFGAGAHPSTGRCSVGMGPVVHRFNHP